MMALNPNLLQEILEEFSVKHDADLINMTLGNVKQILTKEEWEVVHDVIKYGKDKRKYH